MLLLLSYNSYYPKVVPVEVTLDDTVAKIKSKVTEVIGLPAGKQKILSPTVSCS